LVTATLSAQADNFSGCEFIRRFNAMNPYDLPTRRYTYDEIAAHSEAAP
jgi:hypothetical protein